MLDSLNDKNKDKGILQGKETNYTYFKLSYLNMDNDLELRSSSQARCSSQKTITMTELSKRPEQPNSSPSLLEGFLSIEKEYGFINIYIYYFSGLGLQVHKVIAC